MLQLQSMQLVIDIFRQKHCQEGRQKYSCVLIEYSLIGIVTVRARSITTATFLIRYFDFYFTRTAGIFSSLSATNLAQA